MDRQVIDQKLESLRRCLGRIQKKFPAKVDELQTIFDLQDFTEFAKAVAQWSDLQQLS